MLGLWPAPSYSSGWSFRYWECRQPSPSPATWASVATFVDPSDAPCWARGDWPVTAPWWQLTAVTWNRLPCKHQVHVGEERARPWFLLATSLWNPIRKSWYIDAFLHTFCVCQKDGYIFEMILWSFDIAMKNSPYLWMIKIIFCRMNIRWFSTSQVVKNQRGFLTATIAAL